MFNECVELIRRLYPDKDRVLLHEPVFLGREKEYLEECINSTMVSYVGPFVNRFEKDLETYTGSAYIKAMINGTSAMHIALKAVGVRQNELVITQSLTFVATANSIAYCGAEPVFVDIEEHSMGMDPASLRHFLETETSMDNGHTRHRGSGKKITACIPVHVMGLTCDIDSIVSICEEYKIAVIEDAAEAIGSHNRDRHLGTIADIGILSFNGNKTITAGCGGAVLCNNEDLSRKIQHLSTTAKQPHAWEFIHDEVGYNYRLSNVSAAIGVAQLEMIDAILESKRSTAETYRTFFADHNVYFSTEGEGSISNYWLNTIRLNNMGERDSFLVHMNRERINCRPLWRPMHMLPIYGHCTKTDMSVTEKVYSLSVNLPSGYR